MFQIYTDKGNILHFSKFFVLFCFPTYTRVLYQLKFSGEAGSIGYRCVLKYIDIYIEKDRDIEILKNWLLCLWAWQTLKSVGQASRLETQEGFLCHSLDTDILLLETTVFWFLVVCWFFVCSLFFVLFLFCFVLFLLLRLLSDCVYVAQLCLTLCDPMDCIPPGFTVLVILQARILEWLAIYFFRGSSQPGDQTQSPALQVDSFLSESPREIT